jgi:hypothetical protein
MESVTNAFLFCLSKSTSSLLLLACNNEAGHQVDNPLESRHTQHTFCTPSAESQSHNAHSHLSQTGLFLVTSRTEMSSTKFRIRCAVQTQSQDPTSQTPLPGCEMLI